ncbi:NADH-quinone oxidoreductase subunit M [Halopseudomonas pertucinogena]|uniref:NADH-quinone oxidoreductase subunit M n=1 Tax=Halopseudomonas pertucinogena TaxID=86175 RepID=A0ABQ2CVR9_9GAMM|nr:NADH-quinone oxidoreductase subunit M [Halopseudomonas pertucinogena]GGJ06812.1 NADH-quinone oxidoreductase subunit M [Halopseudomonas pertucinogena]
MILPWLVLIPFIGGLLCWLTERHSSALPRWIALLTMGLVLALSLWLWVSKDYSMAAVTDGVPVWTMEFKYVWIERFGINLHLALDGLSLLMLILTGILGVLSVLCSWNEIQHRIGFFHLNLMWILGGVAGVFLAMDLFLFFFFWEMMLVPMYFLIALWGHSGAGRKTRINAATKFFIYTQASGLIMLVAILGLVLYNFNQTGVLTFAYDQLLGLDMPAGVEYILMLGFFIAFAVKFPVVPLHSWLPDAHAQAPTAGSVDLAGILLKTAAYGMLRFALPLFPDASVEFAPIAMTLGLIGIFYGAILSFAQTDIKRLVAYSSISHMGFVLIGIYATTHLALQGAVVQMVAHGLSAAALFILCGQLYERIHTRDMREMGGLWARLRWLPALSMFFAIASLGMPGTGNFVGEFLILFGSFADNPWVVVIATFGLVLASAYSLIMIHRAYFGAPREGDALRGLNARELAMMLSLVALVVALGLYPQPVLDTSAASMSGVQHWLSDALSNLVPVR